MSPSIVKDRIDGTRITVWDVYLYLKAGRSNDEIGQVLPLTGAQIEAAIAYIHDNREYVEEGHRRIEERNARGNPPEIEAKLVETRKRMQQWQAGRNNRTNVHSQG